MHLRPLPTLASAPANSLPALFRPSARGRSLWLTALPLDCYGWLLARDHWCTAVALRYLLPQPFLPPVCGCGSVNSVPHALNCKTGGHVVRRHNRVVRNLHAAICSVAPSWLEPVIAPVLPGTHFRHSTTNAQPGARSDILAENLLDPHLDSYIDVVVIGPSHADLAGQLRNSEMRKHREYGEGAVMEGRTFSAFACSTSGAMGEEARRLVQLVARRRAEDSGLPYGPCVLALRLGLCFSLLRSALDSLLGPHVPVKPTQRPVDTMSVCRALVTAWARVDRATES